MGLSSFFVIHRGTDPEWGDPVEWLSLDTKGHLSYGEVTAFIVAEGMTWSFPIGTQTELDEKYPGSVALIVYDEECLEGFDVWLLLSRVPTPDEEILVLTAISQIEGFEFDRPKADDSWLGT